MRLSGMLALEDEAKGDAEDEGNDMGAEGTQLSIHGLIRRKTLSSRSARCAPATPRTSPAASSSACARISLVGVGFL